MKRFAVTRKINPANINLALVDNVNVISNEAIEISRYSTAYEDNLVPIFNEHIETGTVVHKEAGSETEIGSTFVDLTLLSEDFMLTDEVIYDNDNLRVVPLWYEYKLRNFYFNKTKDSRIVERVMDGEYINNVLPDDTREIILEDSTFTITPIGRDPLPSHTYRLDLNNNRILITHPLVRQLLNPTDEQGNVINKLSITIEFQTIIPDINIQYYDGTSVDPSLYRLVVESYTTNPESVYLNMYNARILFSDILDSSLIRVIYDTFDSIYTEIINDETVRKAREKQTEEIVNASPIFTKMSLLPNQSIFDALQDSPSSYIIDSGTIYSTISTHSQAFVKYDNITSEKITILEPQGRQIQYPWYMDIQPGTFTDGGYTYNIIERDSYSFQGRVRISKTREEVDRLGPALLRVQNKNLYTTFNRNGDITNLSLFIDGIQRFGFIRDIDASNGLLILKKDVSAKNSISVEYSYFTTFVPYVHVNVNPSKRFIDNYDIIQKYMVMYMLPIEELNVELGRSMFHLFVYKHPAMYLGVKEYEISVEKAEIYINGLDDQYKSNIHNIIPEYIKPGAGDILHPKLIGVVNVNATKTENAAKILDIRLRGGGIIDHPTFQKKLWNDIKSYIDIAKWDGALLNVNNTLVLEIPLAVVERVATKMRLFDTDTIRAERETPGSADISARSYVEGVIKKYTPVTKHIHVRFI